MSSSSSPHTTTTTTEGIVLSFIQPSYSPKKDSHDTAGGGASDEADIIFTLLPQLFTSHILGTTSSTLYKPAAATAASDDDNPGSSKRYYLLVSAIDDVARVNVAQVAKFWAGEEKVLGEGDVRVFAGVEVFEKAEGKRERERGNPAHTLLLALMQPAPGGAADLDAWYRDEHNEQMSREPGWLRTCRYSLVTQKSGNGQEEKELSFLAIHEFDESNELGDTVKALEPVSEWTKKVMREAVGIDAAIYRRV